MILQAAAAKITATIVATIVVILIAEYSVFWCLMRLLNGNYIYFSLILKQHVQYTSWEKVLIKTVFWLFVLLLCNLANCYYYNNGYYCCCCNHFQNQNVSYLLWFLARGRMKGIMNMNTNSSLSDHKQKIYWLWSA